MPRSLDPARASAPPETDIVRAIFDGLTDTDPNSLKPVPSIAIKWEASEDKKTWIFHLRKDARWTNGEKITARDFVRSWERVLKLAERSPQRRLFENIAGMTPAAETVAPPDPESPEPLGSGFRSEEIRPESGQNESPTPTPTPTPKFEPGVVALDALTLKVSLERGDPDFPALVSHPVFRPVHGDGKDFDFERLYAGIVTSGPFRISSIGPEGLTLDRSENHWDRANIELERVRFVPIESAEKALEAYRLGEVDAVTNAHFEPLALKLLKPFEDFRQTTHAALNFYEFNRMKTPFDDRRVREALALAIERDRLTEGEMEGATRPATSFLPFGSGESQKLKEDSEKARRLLTEAGFPDGEGFPTIRLVINRNDTQQRVAKLVARMWEEVLKVKTTLITVEPSEIDRIRMNGDFDLIRRGVVLPAADEENAMVAIFSPPNRAPLPADPLASPSPLESPEVTVSAPESQILPEASSVAFPEPPATHEDAIKDIPAIPLYFPTSFSLVKPYVSGFEMNVLDAPSLKSVRVDTAWKPPKAKDPS